MRIQDIDHEIKRAENLLEKIKDDYRQDKIEWEEKYPREITQKARELIRNKKHRCKQKDIPFDLDVDWLRPKLNWGCELTNLPFQFYRGNGNPYSPSIDRIDPNGGYLKENCRAILLGLNNMKLLATDEDVYKIAEALLKGGPNE